MARLMKPLFALAAALAAFSAYAQTPGGSPATPNSDDFYAIRPATIYCVIRAAQKQGVPANVLLALASVEGGKNGQFVGNTNGSRDIGHFQINTIHWKQNGRLRSTPRSLNRMSHGAAATTQSLPLGCFASTSTNPRGKTSGHGWRITTPRPRSTTPCTAAS